MESEDDVMIAIDELPSLADYLNQREVFRRDVIALKQVRLVRIGENVTLLFENRQTVLYQILEMLRIEKTTDRDAIQAELDAYNPLIPAGTDWRATMLVEFEDAEERRVQLKYLRLVEHSVYADIGGQRVMAIADEDMQRSDEEKTSAVHFLRFPLSAAAIASLRAGAALQFGIGHPRYRYQCAIDNPATRAALLSDLA
jgi:Protein of unknown function (DUF3501)